MNSRPAPDDITEALASDRLGVPAVLFFVMSAAAPLTVVAGTLTTAYAVTQNTALPSAFIVVGVILALFSVGYVSMGRHLPHAGAFYAYVSHGIGRAGGVGTAWLALLAYNMIQVCLYGAIGAATSPLIEDWAGLTLPWWFYALVTWALVALLGILRVDFNSGLLAALLLLEVTLIVIYDFSYLLHPADGYELSNLSPTNLSGPGVGAILAIAVLGFVGFESAVVFSEESRNPRRTVPRATYLSVVIIATLYGLSAWAMAVSAGADQIAAQSAKNGPDIIFMMADTQLGGTAATLGHVLFATSIIAAMISFHNTIARYVFALGRERVLPAVFGRTTPSGAPRAASLSQSAVALVVIVVFALTGADPVVKLFYTLSAAGALGILLLICLAAAAVLAFFAKDKRGEDLWHTLIAPGIALVGVLGTLVLVLQNFAGLLGVEESSPLRWGIPALFVVVGLGGTLYGVALRSMRPDVFAAIGRGAKSRSSMLAPDAPSLFDTTAAATGPRAWEGRQ